MTEAANNDGPRCENFRPNIQNKYIKVVDWALWPDEWVLVVG